MRKLLLIIAFMATLALAPVAWSITLPGCIDFNDQLLHGWHGQAVTVSLDQPGPSGLSTDYYLKAKDEVSPPNSVVLAGPPFLGNWLQVLQDPNGGTGGCAELSFDFRVINDGEAGHVSRAIVVYIFNGSLRARFFTPAYDEDGGPNPGWHGALAPICASLPPGWEMLDGATAADWPTLISNVTSIEFGFDWTSYQYETIGLDNICLRAALCDNFVDGTNYHGYTFSYVTKDLKPGGPGAGDYYLWARDLGTPYGQTSYIGAGPALKGNWLTLIAGDPGCCGCGEFSFDFRVIADGDNNPNVHVHRALVVIISGGGYRARFASPLFDEDNGNYPGWHRATAPICPTLPNGWTMLDGAPASAWPALISTVADIRFSFDWNSLQYETIGLDNICIGCAPCTDVWMADTPADVGTEPNQNSPTLYISEDIWVRNTNDGGLTHQNPKKGPNSIYARVRNKGCETSQPAFLNVCWTKASTAMLWPAQWIGSGFGYIDNWCPGGVTNPYTTIYGNNVATVAIPPIPPGGSLILPPIYWDAPDPSLFACFGTDAGHFCLLARIITDPFSASYGMTFPEGPWIWENTKNNNNIVWKNVTVVPGKKSNISNCDAVIARNLLDNPATINMAFRIPDNELNDPFLNYGNVTLKIDPPLLAHWLLGGMTTTGFVVSPEAGTLLMDDTTAWLTNIPMDAAEQQVICLEYSIFENRRFALGQQFNLNVTQYTAGSEAPDGGMAYNIQVGPLPVIAIEKIHNALQGHYTTVSIKATVDELEMGGFDFLIAYDAAALTFTEAEPGQLLEDCGWEYFTYRFGANGNCGSACPSGLLRIVALAETNNGDIHPSCYGPPDTDPHELAVMKFLISNDRTLECQYVPIRFFWGDCGDNAVSSADGELLYIDRAIYDFEGNLIWDETNNTQYPENARIPFVGAPDYCLNPDSEKPSALHFIDFFNGGVDIICADSIDARGDVNLNGLSNEIGDAVVFTNYFITGLAAFTVNVEGQIAASEVNCDGIPLSVADLVYLIRVIIGDALPCAPTGKLQALKPIEAALDRTPDGTLSVSGTTLIGAAYLVVEGEVTPVLKAEGMKMVFRFDGTNTRILIYPPFENSEKSIRGFSGEFLEVKGNIVTADLATVEGVPVKLNLTPAKFALAQNFPNPFNLATQVEFSLPAPSQVKLEIYNVMGQLVRTLVDEQLPAGYHKVIWDGRNDVGTITATGIYFYKLRAANFTETKKMMMLK